MSDLFYLPEDASPSSSLIVTNTDSPFGHTFGGEVRHKGATAKGASQPLHLFYNFNLNDPNCQVEIPGCSWLPLYSAIRFNSSPLYYRIVSDTDIEIIEQSNIEIIPDFPYDDYPAAFDKMPVSLCEPEPVNFDEDQEEDWDTRWYPETPPRPPSRNELIECAFYINYGFLEPCRNPGCGKSTVNYLAAFRDEWLDDEGVSIWGGQEYVVIVFYLCYSCFTVSTFNLCN